MPYFEKGKRIKGKGKRNFKRGFSLIELMVVISLFGITTSLITASYIGFERNQRIKNATSRLKNDLRFVQNKANSGDKGLGGVDCDPADTQLGGWYLIIEEGVISYDYGGVCNISSSSEDKFSEETVGLPSDTKINRIYYLGVSSVSDPVAVFFRPLKSGVTFHEANAVFSGSNPDFFDDSSGSLLGLLSPYPTGSVSVEISNLGGGNIRTLQIDLSGEISEQ
jgi:prepilin-type N-terminal cleavage/methylation domain-containing protein